MKMPLRTSVKALPWTRKRPEPITLCWRLLIIIWEWLRINWRIMRAPLKITGRP